MSFQVLRLHESGATPEDKLLPQQRVFDKQFGLPFGKVCDRSKQKGGGARFHPTNDAIVERVKAQRYSLPERDENREYSILLCVEKGINV
jgi:hypothetical protein